MRKIPTLFKRDPVTFKVTREVMKDCEWVLEGQGKATRKWNGTCCAIIGGKLYKRYQNKTCAVVGAIPVSEYVWWVPVGSGPEDQWHRQGLTNSGILTDGTYELVGPKIQDNAEARLMHVLIKHGEHIVECERSYEGIREFVKNNCLMEGIVFWHDDGRRAKIKRSDFLFE